jgi:protein phosphatase
MVLLLLIAGVIAAIGVYARGSYFVGLDQGQITIYKGRPGGLLWFGPTVAQRTGISTNSVLSTRLSDLQSGKEEASLADARQYVRNLQQEAAQHQVGGTTTTAPPTTGSTTPAPPTPPVKP